VAAVEVLNELEGLAELEERDGAVVIPGYSCPLAAVTPDHPEVCRMAEALITELWQACRSASIATVAGVLAAVSRWWFPRKLRMSNQLIAECCNGAHDGVGCTPSKSDPVLHLSVVPCSASSRAPQSWG